VVGSFIRPHRFTLDLDPRRSSTWQQLAGFRPAVVTVFDRDGASLYNQELRLMEILQLDHRPIRREVDPRHRHARELLVRMHSRAAVGVIT
jgi:hypothetical protein